MGAKEASTDKFPDEAVKKDLPNSHRFGQKIADLADPLGITLYGLIGQGPPALYASDPIDAKHTIFLFDENSIDQVLCAYGDLLLDIFSDYHLREGVFVAVGQVHKPPVREDKLKWPQHVGNYWSEYRAELSNRNPTPRVFVQYVLVGQRKSDVTREVYWVVEKIAAGVLRLAGMLESSVSSKHRRYSHRHVMRLLYEHADVQRSYEELVATFAVNGDTLTKRGWEDHWRDIVRTIAETIAKKSFSSPEVEKFLEWDAGPSEEAPLYVGCQRGDNIFRYPSEDPKVDIHVGSIHSIKGETHMATLVYETFWNKHNLHKLKPWLTGDRKGWNTLDGFRQKERLKVHYVAMTRPTHLLCLAMRQATFETEQGDIDQEALEALRNRGWQVKMVPRDEPLSEHQGT